MAKKVYSKLVQETLDAIPNVKTVGDMIAGLMATADAVRNGEITIEESKAITKAVNKQRRAFNAALKGVKVSTPRVRVPSPHIRIR